MVSFTIIDGVRSTICSKKVRLIDTHTHLYGEDFEKDMDAVIARAKDAGVVSIFLPNVDVSTMPQALAVAHRYPDFAYPMMGLQPEEVRPDFRDVLAKMHECLKPGNPYIAIGEVGLDFYWDTTYSREQREAFDIQIQWALELGLPLMIHARAAHRELMEALGPYRNEGLRGSFHSFSGTEEEAAELLGFDNFVLGINGIVTFKKSTLPEVLKNVPLERIVLETDSPYLAPVPHRGQRNESSYLRDVLVKIGEIYELPLEKIAKVTTETALRVFGNSKMKKID